MFSQTVSCRGHGKEIGKLKKLFGEKSKNLPFPLCVTQMVNTSYPPNEQKEAKIVAHFLAVGELGR